MMPRKVHDPWLPLRARTALWRAGRKPETAADTALRELRPQTHKVVHFSNMDPRGRVQYSRLPKSTDYTVENPKEVDTTVAK